MIYDKLADSERYDQLCPRIGKLLRYLRSHNLNEFADGKVELEGDKLFFTISSYATRAADEVKLEAHKDYIDLQYLIEGEENFGFAFKEPEAEPFESDAEKDLYFYKGENDFYKLGGGRFMLVFPGELHRPGVDLEAGRNHVRKLVAKIKVG